jgi:hypothetical protein
MVGWMGNVQLYPIRAIAPDDLVAVISKMENVSIVSGPHKFRADAILDGVRVKRGNVVALVQFPTATGLRHGFSSINISTQWLGPGGDAFVRDLAEAMQSRFGDRAATVKIVPMINDGGP